MKPQSFVLPSLRNKFALLFANGTRVRNAAGLAAYMKVSRSTVSGWVAGVKGKEPGRVTAAVLAELCTLFCLENPQIHSEDEAKALWIGHLEEFRASFVPVAADIIKTLEKISPDLPVRHDIRDPSVLGMFEDAVVIPEEAVLLKADCEVAFQIDGRVGLRLVVLAEEPAGWRILGPGPRHTGRIENRPERVPNVAPMTIRFKAPYGLCRFVFVELPHNLSPLLPPAGSIAALSPGALGPFARQLASKAWTGRWRWSQAVFNVLS